MDSVTNPLIDRFSAATEDGEFITAIYHGGHTPGAKRRLLPIRIAGDRLYAKSTQSARIKTYLLDKIEPCDDNHPAPWIDDEDFVRQKTEQIDPKKYFSDWAYDIGPHFYSALGVSRREYIDKEKTARARTVAKAEGRDSTRVAIKYLAWVIGKEPDIDFHVGDLFHSTRSGIRPLQVYAINEFIEVHHIVDGNKPRHAYHIVDDELVEWLRTGIPPNHGWICPGQSYKEILRYSLADPLDH